MKKGDLIRYKDITSILIKKNSKDRLGIVITVPSGSEFVEVVWNNGQKQKVFRDFVEVVLESWTDDRDR